MRMICPHHNKATNNMSFNTFRPSSICIKRVHSSVTDDEIAQTFIDLFEKGFTQDGAKFMCTRDGESPIEKIDMVPRIDHRTQEEFWLVFIHFKDNVLEFEETPRDSPVGNMHHQTEAHRFSTHLDDPNVTDIRVQYRYPYFFKCVKNTSNPKAPTQAKVLTEEDTEELLKVQKERAVSWQVGVIEPVGESKNSNE